MSETFTELRDTDPQGREVGVTPGRLPRALSCTTGELGDAARTPATHLHRLRQRLLAGAAGHGPPRGTSAASLPAPCHAAVAGARSHCSCAAGGRAEG